MRTFINTSLVTLTLLFVTNTFAGQCPAPELINGQADESWAVCTSVPSKPQEDCSKDASWEVKRDDNFVKPHVGDKGTTFLSAKALKETLGYTISCTYQFSGNGRGRNGNVTFYTARPVSPSFSSTWISNMGGGTQPEFTRCEPPLVSCTW